MVSICLASPGHSAFACYDRQHFRWHNVYTKFVMCSFVTALHKLWLSQEGDWFNLLSVSTHLKLTDLFHFKHLLLHVYFDLARRSRVFSPKYLLGRDKERFKVTVVFANLEAIQGNIDQTLPLTMRKKMLRNRIRNCIGISFTSY